MFEDLNEILERNEEDDGSESKISSRKHDEEDFKLIQQAINNQTSRNDIDINPFEMNLQEAAKMQKDPLAKSSDKALVFNSPSLLTPHELN